MEKRVPKKTSLQKVKNLNLRFFTFLLRCAIYPPVLFYVRYTYFKFWVKNIKKIKVEEVPEVLYLESDETVHLRREVEQLEEEVRCLEDKEYAKQREQDRLRIQAAMFQSSVAHAQRQDRMLDLAMQNSIASHLTSSTQQSNIGMGIPRPKPYSMENADLAFKQALANQISARPPSLHLENGKLIIKDKGQV